MPSHGLVKPKDLTHTRAGKYRNKPTSFNGIRFDSIAEMARYVQLAKLERVGRISLLQIHERFPLVVGGVKVATYEADFCYYRGPHHYAEDVKGH